MKTLSQEIMNKIGIEISGFFTPSSCLLQIPFYKVKNTNYFIAQIDRSGNDLRPKDIWQLYGGNHVIISNDFLIDCTGNELINEIEEHKKMLCL